MTSQESANRSVTAFERAIFLYSIYCIFGTSWLKPAGRRHYRRYDKLVRSNENVNKSFHLEWFSFILKMRLRTSVLISSKAIFSIGFSANNMISTVECTACLSCLYISLSLRLTLLRCTAFPALPLTSTANAGFCDGI